MARPTPTNRSLFGIGVEYMEMWNVETVMSRSRSLAGGVGVGVTAGVATTPRATKVLKKAAFENIFVYEEL